MDRKILGRAVGTIAVIGVVAGTMAAGDALNFNSILLRNATKISPQSYVVETGFYQHPYDLKIEIEKNSSGRIETYIASKEKRYPVRQGAQDLIVGSLDDIADNLTSEDQETIFMKFPEDEQRKILGLYVKDKFQDEVEKGKNWLSELYNKIKNYFQQP